ncbi:hypothetical protein WOLCODRAFT_159628 [Wolfiporia cocos MD-104 SS10]|uniref:HAT C-terminal dimerisation domain-containing protein n=1 Tax=Wolfiporia cocos (strain MD-104) TaxID=742152 RepID=A0A2H3JC89_WOLCO|nr:hypothetical protein WOLCODRAFT_159628 [Wolfiporia cocos MD-104 SS10]
MRGSRFADGAHISSAGITISKRRNRLKADVVEALQFLKCSIRRDLLFRNSPSLLTEPDAVDETGEPSQSSEAPWDEVVEGLSDSYGTEILGDDDDDVYVPLIN